MVKDNTLIVLAAEVILLAVIMFVSDPILKASAVGAAVGLAGGHLNGSGLHNGS